MNRKIFSDNCSVTIGCIVHRNWDNKANQTIQTGFASINEWNSDNLYGSNTENNKKAKQYLCFLANHQIINYLMEQQKYYVHCLEELNEKDFKTDDGIICYGLNKGIRTKKIAIRLRNNNIFLPYDTIIDTMIHELVHMDEWGHGKNFMERQNRYRSIYDSFEKISWENSTNFDWLHIKKQNLLIIFLIIVIFCLIFSKLKFEKNICNILD